MRGGQEGVGWSEGGIGGGEVKREGVLRGAGGQEGRVKGGRDSRDRVQGRGGWRCAAAWLYTSQKK
eukprot:355490-Chlamydomonas_euryale.AAC.14